MLPGIGPVRGVTSEYPGSVVSIKRQVSFFHFLLIEVVPLDCSYWTNLNHTKYRIAVQPEALRCLKRDEAGRFRLEFWMNVHGNTMNDVQRDGPTWVPVGITFKESRCPNISLHIRQRWEKDTEKESFDNKDNPG